MKVKDRARPKVPTVETVPKATHRILLMRRYIDGLSLDDIADAEYKSRTWVVTNLKAAMDHITL